MPPAINGGLGVSRQRRILSYIDAHLQDDLTLERMAAEVDLSPDHFGRAFRASLGIPSLRYVAQRRLHRAKALLLDHGLSITDIAMALGFATPSHFTSNFHKSTGTTHHRSGGGIGGDRLQPDLTIIWSDRSGAAWRQLRSFSLSS